MPLCTNKLPGISMDFGVKAKAGFIVGVEGDVHYHLSFTKDPSGIKWSAQARTGITGAEVAFYAQVNAEAGAIVVPIYLD